MSPRDPGSFTDGSVSLVLVKSKLDLLQTGSTKSTVTNGFNQTAPVVVA